MKADVLGDIAEITEEGELDLYSAVSSDTGLKLDKNERIIVKKTL